MKLMFTPDAILGKRKVKKLDSKLREEWLEAIQKCGGLRQFEERILPSCSDAVKMCWNKIVKAEFKEVKA